MLLMLLLHRSTVALLRGRHAIGLLTKWLLLPIRLRRLLAVRLLLLAVWLLLRRSVGLRVALLALRRRPPLLRSRVCRRATGGIDGWVRRRRGRLPPLRLSANLRVEAAAALRLLQRLPLARVLCRCTPLLLLRLRRTAVSLLLLRWSTTCCASRL